MRDKYIVIIEKWACYWGLGDEQSKENVKSWFQSLSTKQFGELDGELLTCGIDILSVGEELPWIKIVIDVCHSIFWRA